MDAAQSTNSDASRPDRLLLALARAGDRDAAGEIYERYARRLLRLAGNRATGVVEADDVVQSAFRTFLAGVKRGCYEVPEGRDLWALLVVVTLNKLRGYARAAGTAKRAAPACRLDPDSLPDRAAPDPVAVAAARDVLTRFSSRERELIELRLAGHPVEGIAERVYRSKRTVERTLQSCRERLLTLMATDE